MHLNCNWSKVRLVLQLKLRFPITPSLSRSPFFSLSFSPPPSLSSLPSFFSSALHYLHKSLSSRNIFNCSNSSAAPRNLCTAQELNETRGNSTKVSFGYFSQISMIACRKQKPKQKHKLNNNNNRNAAYFVKNEGEAGGEGRGKREGGGKG